MGTNTYTPVPSEEMASWEETPPLHPPLRRWSGQALERQTWLDKLADPLQKWIHAKTQAPDWQWVKDILRGTWFGHPLHPALTDIPLGAWTSALLLDICWLNSESQDFARAADVTLAFGLVGGGAAALAGLTDWSETDATDRRVGLVHGLLNLAAMLTNLTSYGLRRMGRRRTGIMVSGLGYTLGLFSAYLGGELSFARGIGVNHVAWEGGSNDFIPVMKLGDLSERTLQRVDAAGMPVVLWREGPTICALAATCSHLGGPLDEGSCHDGAITCPWHGSTFRLSDGSVVRGPAVYAQPTCAVRVRDGNIELRRVEHA